MAQKTRRELRQERRSKELQKQRLIRGSLAVVVVGIIGFLVWNLTRPSLGLEVPIMPNSGDHVEPGTAIEYSTSPPTSGPHYGNSLPPDFYEEADLASLSPNPEGYLVHNLEHGHVVLWYNCERLDSSGCNELKSQIRNVLNEYSMTKVVAFPWSAQEAPLVLTSWGQIQTFDTFDEDAVNQFIQTNRNRSPEPNAP